MTVTTNDVALDRALRETVDAGASRQGPVNFRVEVADAPGRFHRLLWGRCPVVRTLDHRRLLQGLDRHLSAATPARGLLDLELPTLVRGTDAVLLPPSLLRRTGVIERRANERGWALSDMPFARIDVTSAELIVSDAGLVPIRETLGLWPVESGRQEPTVLAGRYRLRRAYFDARPGVVPSEAAFVLELARQQRGASLPEALEQARTLLSVSEARSVDATNDLLADLER